MWHDVTIPGERGLKQHIIINYCDLCTMVYSWNNSMPWCSTEALALLTKYRIFKARLWPPLSGRQMADGCSYFFWTCWYELGIMSRGLPQNAVFILISQGRWPEVFIWPFDHGWWNCSISHILWCSGFVMFVEDMRFSIWHIMAVGSLLCSFVWSGGLPGLRNGLYRLPYRGFKGGVAQIFWMGRFTGSKRFSTSTIQTMRGPVDSLDMETWLFFADQQHM